MNYKFKDSYKITDIKTIKTAVTYLYFNDFIGKSRTITSYVKEWNAHNVLYKLGLFRSHTKDVDLNDDEPKYRLIIYSIIWLFRKRDK